MFLSKSCTSSASWCSTACTVKCLRTSWNFVPTSRRCHIAAASPIHHPTVPSRTAPSAQLLRPTGFLCGWSVGLEFPAGQLAESRYWREQFETISEDVSVLKVSNVLMYPSDALEVSWRCALFIDFLLTYLLTYLLTRQQRTVCINNSRTWPTNQRTANDVTTLSTP